MFFWKIKDLKNALIHRELTEKQVFIYILIFVLLSIVAMEITRYLHPDRVGFWDYVDSFLSISIVLCGTVFLTVPMEGRLAWIFLQDSLVSALW